MSVYTSSKQIELGSAAFRQWRASHSHCRFLHGYQLKAKFTFGCKDLDDRSWCVDFGGLNELKQTLRDQFDHTTVVAGDDPELETFKTLNDKGIIQLRIMDGGVGSERFAEWVFKTADTFIEEATEGRCFVLSVTVTEHDDNGATYMRQIGFGDTKFIDEEGTQTYVTHEEFEKTWKDWQQQKEDSSPQTEQPKAQPEVKPQPKPQPRPANVGNQVTQGKGNWFKGTSWGD
tara:strand:- start:1364 stop:2056 length:693 start_codon:yes stop_codon:yes gene_type:complete